MCVCVCDRGSLGHLHPISTPSPPALCISGHVPPPSRLQLGDVHLGCISAASRPHLGRISAASRPHLRPPRRSRRAPRARRARRSGAGRRRARAKRQTKSWPRSAPSSRPVPTPLAREAAPGWAVATVVGPRLASSSKSSYILGYISAISRLYLGCISAVSRLYLGSPRARSRAARES